MAARKAITKAQLTKWPKATKADPFKVAKKP